MSEKALGERNEQDSERWEALTRRATWCALSRRYGSIRQVRRGTEGKAKGTAFVVYEDVMDVRDC